MRHLAKPHSPRLPPCGLSILRLWHACCGSCYRSGWPHLASGGEPFSHYRLLVKTVCSRRKGSKKSIKSLSQRNKALQRAAVHDRRWWSKCSRFVSCDKTAAKSWEAAWLVTDLASSPPRIGLRTTGDQRGLICKVSGQKNRCYMTSHDITRHLGWCLSAARKLQQLFCLELWYSESLLEWYSGSSTGLRHFHRTGWGPRHPARPARRCCWEVAPSLLRHFRGTTKRFNSQRSRLDAGALVDPAPFDGIVFVGVVLKDTAALVVLQEILCKTGLRHRAHFQKRMFIACPHSFLDSKSNYLLQLEKTTITGSCWSLYCRPSFELAQEFPAIKTLESLENIHRKCALRFPQHQLSNAKRKTCFNACKNESPLGFQLQKKRIPQSGNAPRAQEAHPQPLLGCHPGAPPKCFRLCDWRACKIEQKQYLSRLFKFCFRCCHGALNSNLEVPAWVLLIKFDKPWNHLQSWNVELQPVPDAASTISISLGSMSACWSCSRHIYTLNRNSLCPTVPTCGSRNGSASNPRIAEADLVFVMLLIENIQMLQKWGASTSILHRCHIQIAQEWLSNKATLDMSLDLHFGCRPFPGWGSVGPSAPCRTGICNAEKTRLKCKKTRRLHPWLICFQVSTERCRNSCKKMSFASVFQPPSGQPEGYRSCSLPAATCPRNNRRSMNLLRTNRF